MGEADNIKVVQEAYAAFGRGDVQAILDRLDDSVAWTAVYGAGPQVPQGGERRGKAAVADFFKQLPSQVTFSTFEPREFIATGNKVVALGHYVGKTPVGKSFDLDFAMVFTLRNGKVERFQEFTDSAAVNSAYTAAGVTA
jgi:ketosteroid isomerase-like protein